jgi:hypothetical protein
MHDQCPDLAGIDTPREAARDSKLPWRPDHGWAILTET